MKKFALIVIMMMVMATAIFADTFVIKTKKNNKWKSYIITEQQFEDYKMRYGVDRKDIAPDGSIHLELEIIPDKDAQRVKLVQYKDKEETKHD